MSIKLVRTRARQYPVTGFRSSALFAIAKVVNQFAFVLFTGSS